MKKLRTILLMGLAALVAVSSAIGGTLAYLTDTESAVNVMTVGNVDIVQYVQERDDSGELVDYVNLKQAVPAVGPVEWDDTTRKINDKDCKFFTPDLKNVIDNIVTVENVGKTRAFVRTIVVIEEPEGVPNDLIHISYNEDGIDVSDYLTVEINGVKYCALVFTYVEALAPGKSSAPSLLQTFLDKKGTNEDCAKFGETWEIMAISQAVQADGFESASGSTFALNASENTPAADAIAALNEAFGVAEEATIAEWFGDLPIPEVVENSDDLVAELENGNDVIFAEDVKINPANMSNAYGTTGINVKNGQSIDGNGKILDIKGAGGTWDSGINTTGGLIKNITVTGSFRGVFINHNSTHSERVVLENVTIDGTTYTISCDQGLNQGLTATNSTFNGWTSYAGTLGDAEFINCSFGEGRGYAFCRPYAPTAFVGCDFEAGYEMDPRAAVTFEDCTIGGVALTSANLATLVTSNIGNATVK